MLLDGEFLSLQEAFTNEIDKPHFIMYEGQIVGKKIKNEVFFDYWNNENLTNLIKFYLKKYHSVPITNALLICIAPLYLYKFGLNMQ